MFHKERNKIIKRFARNLKNKRPPFETEKINHGKITAAKKSANYCLQNDSCQKNYIIILMDFKVDKLLSNVIYNLYILTFLICLQCKFMFIHL